MSKPPFLISSRTGSELWANTIQLPTITKVEVTAKGLTAAEIDLAGKLARAKVDAAAGKLKQYFLSQRQASDSGVAKWSVKHARLEDGLSVRYMRNHSIEELNVKVDANVLLKRNPQYRTVQPLLTTDGWIVRTQQGFLQPEDALTLDDPKHLRIDFEDSLNCGGTNSNVQIVSLTLTLTAAVGNWHVELKKYDGAVEWQNAGYERLDVWWTYSDEKAVATSEINPLLSATSRNLGMGCAMGEPEYSEGKLDLELLEGETITISVYTTTNDGMYHHNAFYDLQFEWYPTTSAQTVLVAPDE